MICVSAGDAVGAKLIKEAGFDSVWVSGFEASTRLGIPDDGSITLEQMINICKPIINATNLPVYVDVDTGYNDFSDTIKAFEDIGAAGICIEDVEPSCKQNSMWGGKCALMDMRKFAQKLDVSRKIHVIARTESYIRGYGVYETWDRLNAYAPYADYILPHSRRQPLPVPMGSPKCAIVPTKFPEYTNHRLRQMGYSMVIWANQTERTKIKAVREMLRMLRISDRMLEAEDGLCTTLDDMKNLTP